MKTCCMCGEQKEADQFHRRAARPGGLRYECKTCKAASAADYRSRNLDAARARSLAWYQANRARVAAAYQARKARAGA